MPPVIVAAAYAVAVDTFAAYVTLALVTASPSFNYRRRQTARNMVVAA